MVKPGLTPGASICNVIQWNASAVVLQWTIIRFFLSASLVMAAVLKATQSGAVLASGGLLSSPLSLAFVVGFELFCASVIALAPGQIARRFALMLFSAFAAVAMWAWWTEQDCGCFGSQTPKAIPLLVDVVAISLVIWALLKEPRSNSSDIEARKRVRALVVSIIAGLVVSVTGGAVVGWDIQRQIAAGNIPPSFGEILIGKTLPLLQDDRFAAHVPEVGEMLSVLLRPDCKHCQEFPDQWPAILKRLPSSVKIVGISMSPGNWTVTPNYVAAKPIGTPGTFAIEWVDNEPFVSSPMIFTIKNRNVCGAIDETLFNSFAGIDRHEQFLKIVSFSK